VDFKDGLSAFLTPVARNMLGLGPDLLAQLGPADLTILFTDIEDYTRVADTFGDAASQDLVRAHNVLVRRALHEFGGHEIKHTGDGIMAWFLSASRAVLAAVRIQQEVEAYNGSMASAQSLVDARGASDESSSADPTPSVPGGLRVRMGLNTGEPILEDGDLYGTPVIVAARVADIAAGRQIVATDVVRQLAAGKGLVFRPLGNERLEGMSEPVGLFEVEWRDPEHAGEHGCGGATWSI